MDQGRAADLKRLDKVIANPLKSRGVKHNAGASRAKIIKQSKDATIKTLRAQLIRATRDGNRSAAKTIEARIKHYEKEPFEDYD